MNIKSQYKLRLQSRVIRNFENDYNSNNEISSFVIGGRV